jgi:hypothetical protein
VHDLHHHLFRFHGIEHILTQRFLFDGLGKFLGGLVVHVGIEQGTTHLLQGLGYIYFGNPALTLQYLKRPLQSVT